MGFVAIIPLLLKLIDAAQLLLPAGHEASVHYDALKAKLAQFKTENRDPTPEEFQELQDETQRLTDRLEASNARLGGH